MTAQQTPPRTTVGSEALPGIHPPVDVPDRAQLPSDRALSDRARSDRAISDRERSDRALSLSDLPAGAPESVVLLDGSLRAVATMAKADVHTTRTPLHLAFSCYLFDGAGRMLVTRRALQKSTWAGVWTNSVCGHQAPGESDTDAVVRRAAAELGVRVAAASLRRVLPDFAYRAVDAGGLVENEFCPVFTGRLDADPRPDPAEVAQWLWVDWAGLADAVAASPWLVSPWAAEQIPQLRAAGV